MSNIRPGPSAAPPASAQAGARRANSLLAALRPTHRDCVVALYAGANKRPRPRDLSPRPGRLNCLVGDFVAEDLFFNLVDSLLIHVI